MSVTFAKIYNDNLALINQWLTGTTPGEPTYKVQASTTTVEEGDTVTFTLVTTGVEEGTVVPFDIQDASPEGGGVISEDDFNPELESLVPALPDSPFIVGADGTASVTFTIAEDGVEEGTEAFNVALQNGQAASANVTITDGGGGEETIISLHEAQPEVTAEEGVAEIFVLNFDSSSGASLSSDAIVTITGFDPTEDMLRFVDEAEEPISAADFLSVATGGALIAENGFAGFTQITFQDDDPAAEPGPAQITLDGILDATLGSAGGEPFFEIV